jgi:hypothetical protein
MPTATKLALGFLLMSGVVMAQPAPAPVPPPSAPPPAAPSPAPAPTSAPTTQPGAPTPGQQIPGAPAAPGAIDLRVQQRPNLTFTDMVTNATDYRQKIQTVGARIQALVEEARKQKDIIRINCLADKLVQVKASLNVADKSFATMQDAIGRQDEGAAFHEYTRVTIVNQNVQVLASEADACVGEDLSYVGATKVDVDVEGVPTGDPTEPGFPTPDVSRPPSASPYI